MKQGQDITEEMLVAGLLEDPLSPKAFAEYFQRFNGKGERDKHQISRDLTVESSAENPLAVKFRTAAEKFRLIDNNGIALIVPFIPLTWQDQSKAPKIVKMTELAAFLSQYLEGIPTNQWQETLQGLRYPTQTKEGFDRSDCPPLPEPFESWFSYLEADSLKHKWVYRELQRYTITISEAELKKLPKGAVFERAGLLVLDRAYYLNVLGVSADDVMLSPEQSVL
ncbi:MAG TPA: CRISPR-associated protein Cas3 [Pasteurellaceae bacterium]|nr:CRISPR-associated protein Cas3 [Pasteurellaceae bacterium]